MQNSHDVDDPISLAVDDEVAGLADNAKKASRAVPAVAQVIGTNSLGKFGSRLGAQAFRIGGDVTESLFEKSLVASCGMFAEFFCAPLQDIVCRVVLPGREQSRAGRWIQPRFRARLSKASLRS